MKTSLIGYPRVGRLRELKFATEKYFRQEITVDELEATAQAIRKDQWLKQAQAGIDFIPVNDFSYYDNLLDAAFQLNIIPKRYQDLELSALDTYFALAKGYQGPAGDVKALAMKKWFNTNYHYIVPEFDNDTEIRFHAERLKAIIEEAKALKINGKVVFPGPFTLLKLSRYHGQSQAQDFLTGLVTAYQDLVKLLNTETIQWLQLDEPYLVHDLTHEDIKLFKDLYQGLLSQKDQVKVLVNTYFGDVRDVYQELTNLAIDGIGLDFIEGKKSQELVEHYGFPKDKTLFLGLVNGKNIWRNNYQSSLALIKDLKSQGIDLVLSTSCSLLHVPYSLENESALAEKYQKHFAFAEEKLGELNDLSQLIDTDYHHDPRFQENQALFTDRPDSYDPKVQERLAAIPKTAYQRSVPFDEREKAQKAFFNLPLFPTTTIGSFPQTKEVKLKRKAFKNGEISQADYQNFLKEKIKDCVHLQEELGLDVLVHGEFERNDMVEYFGEQLNGVLFTEKAWVQSYGTRCVKPPIIWGDVSRAQSMTVSWSVYAQSLTKKPMKGMLTGPVTILNWSFPREDISVKDSTLQLALAIRDEVLDLEANGIRIIQVDEAALREKLPLRQSDWYTEYLDWAIPAFRLVHSGCHKETQIHTHMCYSEFTDIIPAIDAMDADVITFEASRSNLEILDSLKENHFTTEVGPGVYDIHSPRIPSVSEIKEALDKMLQKVKPEKLWVNPDCGLKTRGEKETQASLKHLVQATKELRHENQGIV
ncbi:MULTISPECIES: 5-methyltetrahydropteroyltriglutamate--homocysteine S-methyltransferase [Aerococcus]|uniref:5-methyltetrahydropteroyltriglutamate-- homocysteine S-methyltransferase n=1 Tax=Aerococcus TaxID=1375 RepID=UPI000DCD3A8C|nr:MULTISPECIES: 5-methyltetrahydropteroyltriglutamate--homocysteine S-methyltransferase [Aerococcus]MDK6688613.1 5-methyltetrahydropteroyltriglutamate--homocysteine S-methyltransferase [Aerococcus urinae]MDK8133039.1 5-methyltetrahydropteroyltriglutamate--homocysteine S-methyltransferase [Aerococcus urinae]MDL5177949.1 5-methyltetrahydropteroyltriglutamate--homocysteine S-methyltransferase [Aerococcus tenax]RAV92181.1 5-methyltetrahydropteroyltriglutamate--homocysteine S-methyltransferase [Aer